ncbi:MAG: barstar family protein [Betaproteobacteria bacterium]
MKAPDLAVVDAAGVHAWSGPADPLVAAAAHAHLHLDTVNLGHAKDRIALFAELDRALKLPDHFGRNWDALADVMEDREWLGKRGRVIVITGTSIYRRDHPTDWSTLEEILAEASEFWKERHVAFWVFTT